MATNNSQYIVGVDIGGTFTDCVVVSDQGKVTIGKALSTPDDFAEGAVNAVRDAARNLGLPNEDAVLGATRLFFHACTVGDNTLITRAGAKTGLITTKGFADTLLMMRGRITEGLTEAEADHLAALSKPEPFVPRRLTEEVFERIDYKGAVIIPLTDDDITGAIKRLADKGVESLAVCLLWSILNDSHEQQIAAVLRRTFPNLFFSLSNEVAPFVGEYERMVTTVFNAYIGPKITAYLNNLSQTLTRKGLKREPLIMQAYGGVLGMQATQKNAVGAIESGPASGVVGSQFLGRLAGEENILATDMGGTTFKVSVIRGGQIERDYKPVFMRYNILSPKIWVESIGAGGGSIAWIDQEMGLLKVGPEGAGAKPGPVCYGLGGTEPTVSDANLVLGYLNENYFLGGRMKLDKNGALGAIRERIAKPLGLSVVDAASGIFRIATAHMSDLIRKATVERGYDPRHFVFFGYGGAAPIHASRYAAQLGVKKVIVPITASVHGAAGLISSDVVYEYGKSDHLVVPVDVARINQNFAGMVEQAMNDLHAAGFSDRDIKITRSVDIRYRYQVHELNVPFETGTTPISAAQMETLYDRFDELYEQAYGKGSAYREAGKEIITCRVSGVGSLPKPALERETKSEQNAEAAVKSKRDVYFEEYGKFVATSVYDFDRLFAGAAIAGPAIIETPVTTIVVNPNDRAAADELRNIVVYVGGLQ
ncbi:MAG: hydantoinase/oxoprolinase family protein [Deltaproteobacteria bacterium]|nr:hydantoinase/oxoprolinase family protein [Deltaproteobacteria bacterium]